MIAVSVVIPTYNGSRFVAQTIRSVLNQTLRPVQVIVVDDGSTDGTAHAVRSFPGVEYVHTVNGGTGRARNLGVAAATGDWVAFCDHDDLWQPGYLEAFAARLGPGSVYGFGNWVDVLGMEWTRQAKFSALPSGFFADLGQPLYRNLIDHNPVWPSAVLIRRDFFHGIGGFNPKFSRYATEDFEFTLRCNERAHAAILHDPLVGIRKHRGNYSKGRIRQNLSDAAILEWSAEHHPTGRLHRQAMLQSAAERRSRALDEAFLLGNLAQVREIATALPQGQLDAKSALKVAVARSRIVPGKLIQMAIGRPPEEHQAGLYASAPSTPE